MTHNLLLFRILTPQQEFTPCGGTEGNQKNPPHKRRGPAAGNIIRKCRYVWEREKEWYCREMFLWGIGKLAERMGIGTN